MAYRDLADKFRPLTSTDVTSNNVVDEVRAIKEEFAMSRTLS